MKFLSASSSRFFSRSRERSGLLPRVWWPSVSSQHRVTGPALSTWCLTLSWGRTRWHLFWGRVGAPFPGALSAPELGLADFVAWFERWGQRRVSVEEVAAWAQRSGWADMIRWGGACTWYGRLVLGRAFLAAGAPEAWTPGAGASSPTGPGADGLDDLAL